MPRDGPFWSILEYKQTDIYDSYTLVSNIQYLVWAWWSGVTKVCWANGVTRVCPGLIPALLPADHLLWAATNIAFNLNNLILINLTLTNLILINVCGTEGRLHLLRSGIEGWPTVANSCCRLMEHHVSAYIFLFNLSFGIFRALYNIQCIYFSLKFSIEVVGEGGRFLMLSIFFPLANSCANQITFASLQLKNIWFFWGM